MALLQTISRIIAQHSQLGGLNSDDHPQYVLANGARAFTGAVSGIVPTIASHLATKGYIDGLISALVVDHGDLEGLADDDHTQYHNDARALTWLLTRTTTDISEGTNLYYTEAKVSANIDVASNTAHALLTNNPHAVTKVQVGLANVDNTSDASKPVSTAQQTALNFKADTSSIYTQTQLNGGQLDDRYYTETELNNGQLDVRYYTESEVDGLLATQDAANEISVTASGNLTSTNVQSALEELQGDVDNRIAKHTGATYTTNAIVTLTQAEYDAIVTPDANTLYFII